MACISSVLFGSEGRYNLCGINVNFDENAYGQNVFGNTLFSTVTHALLNNSIVKVTTFGYLHVLIHELGHALAAKLCGDPSPRINIYTGPCQGDTQCSHGNFYISLAGPVLGTVWEIAKLASALALVILVSSPIGLPLGVFLGTGSVFWIFGEVAYACSGNGDWYHILNCC